MKSNRAMRVAQSKAIELALKTFGGTLVPHLCVVFYHAGIAVKATASVRRAPEGQCCLRFQMCYNGNLFVSCSSWADCFRMLRLNLIYSRDSEINHVYQANSLAGDGEW